MRTSSLLASTDRVTANRHAPVVPIQAPDVLPSAPPGPFLKWAGGKGKLLAQLRPLLPAGMAHRRHLEPFVGGGAMFFGLQPARAYLSDVNEALIETYRAVAEDVEGLIAELTRLSHRTAANDYYDLRERYNKGTVRSKTRKAAMFIYLNKTCFNGLHRVNRRGEFNVPYGRYAKPRIVNPDALRAASYALRDVEIRCDSYESLLRTARPGDFVYFDPPYAPVSQTASFTSYAQGGFGDADQTRLRDVFRALDRRGCKLMLSNSDVPLIRELYADYRQDRVAAARAINCDAAKRGKISELVVRNY